MSVVKTAGAVCVGHPDKLHGLIADQILDDILYEDRNARVAVEVMSTRRWIVVTSVRCPRARGAIPYPRICTHSTDCS